MIPIINRSKPSLNHRNKETRIPFQDKDLCQNNSLKKHQNICVSEMSEKFLEVCSLSVKVLSFQSS